MELQVLGLEIWLYERDICDEAVTSVIALCKAVCKIRDAEKLVEENKADYGSLRKQGRFYCPASIQKANGKT